MRSKLRPNQREKRALAGIVGMEASLIFWLTPTPPFLLYEYIK